MNIVRRFAIITVLEDDGQHLISITSEPRGLPRRHPAPSSPARQQ